MEMLEKILVACPYYKPKTLLASRNKCKKNSCNLKEKNPNNNLAKTFQFPWFYAHFLLHFFLHLCSEYAGKGSKEQSRCFLHQVVCFGGTVFILIVCSCWALSESRESIHQGFAVFFSQRRQADRKAECFRITHLVYSNVYFRCLE